MENIINLSDERSKRASEYGEAKYGDAMLMLCACQIGKKEKCGFTPFIEHGASGVFLVALICMGCGCETPINGGKIC